MSTSPILIYRLGSLGDTIVALPCFHAIARAFPDRQRLVLTNIPVSSKAAALELILGDSGLIDGAINYPIGTRSPREIGRLLRRVRATGADTLVYLSAGRGLARVRRDLTFFRLAGIRHIIGAPTTPVLHDNQVDALSGVVEPEAERLARCMAPLGAVDLHDPASWDLGLTAAEHAAADAVLAPLNGTPFVAINLGGKVAPKDWGDANWTALLAEIAPDCAGMGLLAVGAGDDAARSAAVLAGWPGPTLNGCGAMSPRASAAALGRAQVFIGHDSGPLHLASASGTRTVGIFGDYNRPNMWHPFRPGDRVIHDMRGVAAITPAEVAALVRIQLR